MCVAEARESALNSLLINQMIFITLDQTNVAIVGWVNLEEALVFLFDLMIDSFGN